MKQFLLTFFLINAITTAAFSEERSFDIPVDEIVERAIHRYTQTITAYPANEPSIEGYQSESDIAERMQLNLQTLFENWNDGGKIAMTGQLNTACRLSALFGSCETADRAIELFPLRNDILADLMAFMVLDMSHDDQHEFASSLRLEESHLLASRQETGNISLTEIMADQGKAVALERIFDELFQYQPTQDDIADRERSFGDQILENHGLMANLRRQLRNFINLEEEVSECGGLTSLSDRILCQREQHECTNQTQSDCANGQIVKYFHLSQRVQNALTPNQIE